VHDGRGTQIDSHDDISLGSQKMQASLSKKVRAILQEGPLTEDDKSCGSSEFESSDES